MAAANEHAAHFVAQCGVRVLAVCDECSLSLPAPLVLCRSVYLM